MLWTDTVDWQIGRYHIVYKLDYSAFTKKKLENKKFSLYFLFNEKGGKHYECQRKHVGLLKIELCFALKFLETERIGKWKLELEDVIF